MKQNLIDLCVILGLILGLFVTGLAALYMSERAIIIIYYNSLQRSTDDTVENYRLNKN